MRVMCLLLASTACTASNQAPALPELPPATVLATNVTRLAVHGADVYWTEELYNVISVVHLEAAGPRILWQMYLPSPIVDLVAGDEGVVFARHTPGGGCGDMLLIRPDGTTQQLPTLEQGLCSTLPLDSTAGALLYTWYGGAVSEVRRLDLVTGVHETAFTVDGLLYVPQPDNEYDISPATSQQGGYLVRFLRDRPTSASVVVSNIRQLAGLTMLDDFVYWGDNGYAGDLVTLRRRSLREPDLALELVATFPDTWIRTLTSMNGALWVSEDPAVLEHLDGDGSSSRFAVPYTAVELHPLGDALLVRASGQLLIQPLP